MLERQTYEQVNIFEAMHEPYKITKPIRLIELFAGIGSQAKALKNIGADYEHYRVVEFDKYPLASYNAVHSTDFPVLDITHITGADLGITDTKTYEYLLTYSFPCQDLSPAGGGAGMEKGSGTKSGLLWEVERLLKECKQLGNLPQILLMENVPQVHSKKHIKVFNNWIKELENLGYSNYWQDLNAKNYGIPQNRNRCYMVSILGNWYYEFPKPKKLKLKLKDMLEDEVDEKYFISEKAFLCFTNTENRNGYIRADKFHLYDKNKEYSYAITTKEGSRVDDNFIIEEEPKILTSKKEFGRFGEQAIETFNSNLKEDNNNLEKGATINAFNKTISNNQESPTLTTRPEGFKTAILVIDETENIEVSINGEKPKILTPAILTPKRNEYGKSIRKKYEAGELDEKRKNMTDLIPRKDGISNTLTSVQKDNYLLIPEATKIEKQYSDISLKKIQENITDTNGTSKTITANPQRATIDSATLIQRKFFNGTLRICKLTPRECWRLMGFTDEDFDKAQELNSNTQLYKQAGNSIVVQVLEEIFKKLF